MVGIFTGLGSGLVRGSGASLGAAGILGSGNLGRGGENVSVNAATGNLVVSRQDEFLVGRGLDIGISRTYNSFGETSDRDNGDNWQQSTTQRVFDLTGTLNAAGSTVKRLAADGSIVTYSWGTRDGVSGYWSTDGAGSHDRLTRSGNSWLWTDGDTQTVETYGVSVGSAAEWRLVERKDNSNNKLTFSYLADTDKLDRVTTADGSWMSYIWSGTSVTRIETGYTDLATSTAKTLTRTWYDYAGGRLSQVRVDLTPGDNASPSAAQSYWTQYTYDSAGRLSKIVQKDGSQVDVTYDPSGRVATLTQQVAAGDTRITSLTYGAGFTSITGPDGQITRLDYDAAKQLTKITAPPAYTGAAAQVLQFGYDADGNVTTITDANGKVTTNAYDADGNITKITDPNGNTVERMYDAGNRVIREKTYSANLTSPNVDQYARYAYDGLGRLRYTIGRDGQVTEYRYTTTGQLQHVIEYPENGYAVTADVVDEAAINSWRDSITDRSSTKVFTYVYDARGNVVSTFDYSSATSTGGASATDGYTRINTTYDEAGRLIGRNAPGEAAESYIYDGMGRLIATTDIHGGTSTFVFNDAALTTTVTTSAGFTKVQTFNKAGELISTAGSGSFYLSGTATLDYDKNGRLRVSIDETGNKTFYIYDKAGQLVGQANAYGHLTEYRRDAAGRIIAEIRYGNAITAANLATLDNPDNTLQMSALRPAAHSYDLWNWTVYDAGGRVIQTIDGDGGVTAFEYDKSDQLVKTTSYVTRVSVAVLKTTPPTAAVAVTANALDSINRTFYNRNGQIVGILDGEGYLSEITYDAAGQKIAELAYAKQTASSLWDSGTFSQLSANAGATNTANRRVRYVYDGQGLLRYHVDNAGQVTSYAYNNAGKLTSTIAYAAAISTADYTFDNVKVLVTAIANEATDRESYNIYDTIGRLAYSVNADNAVTSFAYDSAGRVTKTLEFAVRRDTPGLPSSATMDTWASAQASNGANRISRSYYTASGQLRFSIDAQGFVRRFDYDAAGRNIRTVTWDNAISVTDATTIAQVNSLVTGTWTDTRMEYDQQGRLASTYDALGNRTYQTYYGTGQLAYVYSAYGTSDQTTTLNIYDGAGRLKTQYNAYGETEQSAVSYTYDGLGNIATMTDARGKVTSYSYDEAGRVISVTNAAGGITTNTYNAFGEVTQTVDTRGGITANTYNALGQLTRSNDAGNINTDYTYTAFGEMASVSRGGAATTFQYDKLGRVTRTTDALNNYEAYTYDATGNRITSRNKLGGTTNYNYDTRGLLISETRPVASYNNAGTAVAASVTNTYSYDARGNRITMVEASGLAEQRTTQYGYDKANRLISTTGQTFMGKTPVTTLAYDARGNMTRTTDPADARTIYYYDDQGRVTATIDPTGTYSATTYDANGNALSVRVYATPVTVPADGGSQEEAPVPAGAYRETTFIYDNLNRLTSSSVAGVKTGYFNGSTWVAATTAITTVYEYDAAGNVVKTTDANGNTTWSYYDLLGRKTAQIDGEGYRTNWTYNADGNVLSERRYALPSVVPTSTATPPAAPASHADDRVTNFTYDLVGNRLTETRTGVQAHNGAGGYSAATSATVSYLYNGLGQVTRKTEATGDKINYTYDLGGRLTVEARESFVDHTGATVSPTVDYYYNAVGDLSRTRQLGTANAAERITTYGYDGGKLYWMRNAEAQDSVITDGRLTYYGYDIAGRQTHEYAARYDSAGALTKSVNNVTASYEGVLTSYDAAGRTTGKWQATYNSSEGWLDNGPRAITSYNAFGEVSAVAIGGVTQQTNVYDNVGRVVSTNAGDGVWKHFGYDKNGNQTIAITSAGASLTGKTFDQALAMINQTDVNAGYTRYDKRNMATIVTETGRQLSIGGTAQTLSTSRGYNAFGEVVSETNALGATITYTYNTMGKLTRSESPAISITDETGASFWVKPSEDYYYDISGRLVATRDANGTYAKTGTDAATATSKQANTGNLTRLTLLAGSGYGGGQALVTSATHADNGVKTNKYDIFGDVRELVSELGFRTLFTYDRMGRVTVQQELRNAANSGDDFYNYYAYDGGGQQLKNWNNALQTPIYGEPVWVDDPYGPNDPYEEYMPDDGTNGHWETPIIGYEPDVATTDYDIQGRVTRERNFGGDVTTTAYAWEAGMVTTGLGTFGGWSQTTTMANTKYSVEKSDLFGRTTYKRDLGAHVTSFTYDAAGRLSSSALGGLTSGYTWLNSGFLGKMTIGSATAGTANTDWTRDIATYTYDKVGNRLAEKLMVETGDYTAAYTYYLAPGEPEYVEESYTVSSTTIKNQTATYDALGRMRSWAETGTPKSPAASVANEYDAAGNVRRTLSTYRTLDANGTASSTATTRDYWFRYDSMNRVVVNQGTLFNGAISRGSSLYNIGSGQDIAYNTGGQRTSVLVTNSYFDGYTGYSNDSKELYYYDEAGRLKETRQLDGTGATGTGTRRSAYSYDLLGRQLSQTDYGANGTTIIFSRSASYNDKSQLISDNTSNLKTDGKTYTTTTSYTYGSGTTYMLGAVVSQNSTNKINGGSVTYSSTTNSYIWYDGALQGSISYKPNTSQSTTYTTTFYYDGMGRLDRAYINDGKPHNVYFTNDELGQVIRRDEANITGQTGAPHEVWYRFAGRQLGYTGNNGTTDMSMAASISDRQAVTPTDQGTFRNKQKTGFSYADFAQNYDPINSYYQGSAGGSYTVQQGDTLQGIAQNLWGDSSLWYKIAEANGLGRSTGLVEGQRLILPTGVTRNTNNASTLKPYDPAEAMGDLSPSTSPKPKKNKCGVMGMILLAVVAVAVTVVTSGAFLAATGAVQGGIGAGIGAVLGTGAAAGTVATSSLIAAGAIGGAVGSVVSQGLGVATGIQDKFSWKGVALAAIAGGIGAGVGPGGAFGDKGLFGTGALAAAGRGAISSAVTQGIGVATGLQNKFDWTGVAAAGISAGVGSIVGDKIAGKLGSKFAERLVSNAASGIASAASRSLIDGTSFGDNILSSLPDIVGSTIGDLVADAVAGDGSPKSGSKETGKSGPTNAKDGNQGSGNGGNGSDNPDALFGDIVVTAQRREAVYRPRIDSRLLIPAQWSERQDTPFTPNGQSFGKTLYDTLTSPLDDARDNARRTLDRLKRQGVEVSVEGAAYILTTAAINSPFTTDLAAQLLTEWRDGNGGARHFYGYDSDATRELFLGYSGDYYRNITSLGISQLASANNGIIRDGSRLAKIRDIPDFSASDGAYGMRDGINVGDVIGTFTYGVSVEARGGYMYFTGRNAMSLGSFSAENRLQHGQVIDPTRGAFSTTYQTFQWRASIPKNMIAN